MTLQTVTTHDGVGYQRVRRHDTTQQKRGRRGIAQQRGRQQIGERQRYQTGEQAEDQKTVGVLLHTLQVHLQAGEEHDIIKTHPAEQLEGVIALQDIKAIRTYGDARHHHTDDMGNPQLSHDDRC